MKEEEEFKNSTEWLEIINTSEEIVATMNRAFIEENLEKKKALIEKSKLLLDKSEKLYEKIFSLKEKE